MKEIKIFIGSSINTFKTERMDLENFIYKISHELFEKNYGVRIVPFLCENLDNYVRVNGTQNAINEEMVLDSDICVFIVYNTIGEFTELEFNLAYKKYKNTNKPQICIYFKNVPEGTSTDQSLKDFITKLDSELHHYHSSFDSIDTIKFRILIKLANLVKEFAPISVGIEDGYCVVDGIKAVSVRKVSEFANNADLKQMYNELEGVENEYYNCKERYESEKEDKEFLKAYSKLVAKREYLKSKINELEKAIFCVSLSICKDEASGKEMPDYLKKAYELFEQGKYEECLKAFG